MGNWIVSMGRRGLVVEWLMLRFRSRGAVDVVLLRGGQSRVELINPESSVLRQGRLSVGHTVHKEA